MKLFITKSFLFSIAFVFLYLFVFTGNSFADAPIVNGYVRNTVTNAAIPGVWVKWADSIGNVRYAQTNSAGFYSFPSWQTSYGYGPGGAYQYYAVYDGSERTTPININLDGTVCTSANIDNVRCAMKATIADANLGNPGGGFGCDQQPNNFTVVLPYNFGGSFSALILTDAFNPINNAIASQDIPDLYYTPPQVVLSGRVTNNLGNPLPVPATITETCNNIGAPVTTGSNGNFSFPSVPSGTAFCMRPPIISGYTLTSGGYECQLAGGFFDPDACNNVHNGVLESSIDAGPDNAYNFVYTAIPVPTATPTPTSAPAPTIASLIVVPDSASGGVEGGSYGMSGLTKAEDGSNYYNSLKITIDTNNTVTSANTNLLAMAFTSPTSAPTNQSLYELTRSAYLGSGFVLVSAVQTRTLVSFYTGTSSGFQDFAAGNYYLYFNGRWDVITANQSLILPQLSVKKYPTSSITRPIFSVTLNKAMGNRSWATHKYLMDRLGAEFRSQTIVCNDKTGINKACTTASIPVTVASSPKKEPGILAYFKKLLAML
ncbi:carboxypeptidase regulatory-like domain-containing protein [Candidatus Microgenomates bacterium]|nr:MAG: carboxypeptidase regulatory-like domain-containing protein [Candidatus Microgenomates bacterium]